MRIISLIFLLTLIFSLFWLGGKPEWFELFPTDPPADKVLHFSVFGFITALVWFSVANPQPLIVFFIGTLLGATDEWHQHYITGRTTSFADFTADLIGIAVTICILRYIQRKASIPI